jgi:prepilin-type processing-associated H-X9-DG protein
MKKSFPNTSVTAGWQTGNAGAFTLTELLVVIGMVAVLGTVLLSASFTTQEGVMRAECVSNLRQIGVGVNLYSTEANGYLPQFNWPSSQNPWQSDEVARCNPGTSIITRGPMGLGILWTVKILPNPRVFYCPSLAQVNSQFSYGYYTWNNNPWPTCPPTEPDGISVEVHVRSGYYYYPQRKALQIVQGYQLPILSWSCPGCPNNANNVVFVSPNARDNPEASVQEPCPNKLTDTDPGKAMTVDVLMLMANLAHQNNGKSAGVNALFPDGHVKFQPVNGNQGLNQAFYPVIWNAAPGGNLGNDPLPSINFRRVMFYFQP